jgi:hypothetical protein
MPKVVCKTCGEKPSATAAKLAPPASLCGGLIRFQEPAGT